jgi:hypothetical protein
MRWSEDEGIYLSPQILTCSPLPILHISPCSSNSLALSMLRYVNEGLAPSLGPWPARNLVVGSASNLVWHGKLS